jgi:hypothetical protein
LVRILTDWHICRQAVFEVSRNYGEGLLLDLGACVEQLLSRVCGLRGVPVLLVVVGGGRTRRQSWRGGSPEAAWDPVHLETGGQSLYSKQRNGRKSQLNELTLFNRIHKHSFRVWGADTLTFLRVDPF